jgi:hypothetical protein
MKFSLACLAAGAFLFALPLLTHAYHIHAFQQSLAMVLSSSANFTMPEEPFGLYISSCAGGASLLILAYLSERKG